MNFLKKALNISNNTEINTNNNTDDKDDFVLVNDGLSQSVWVDIKQSNNNNNNNNKVQSLPIYQVTPIYNITELSGKQNDNDLEEEEMTEEEETQNSQIISQALSNSVSDTSKLQQNLVPILPIVDTVEDKNSTQKDRINYISQYKSSDSYSSVVDTTQLKSGRSGRTIESPYSNTSAIPYASPSTNNNSSFSTNTEVKSYYTTRTTQPYSVAY